MNKIYYLLSLLLALPLSSCNDWLDVSPKSQIQEGDHFSSEGGYRDQLTGVYTAMSTQSMYALNMGIGFILAVDPGDVEKVQQLLAEIDEPSYVIGEVTDTGSVDLQW